MVGSYLRGEKIKLKLGGQGGKEKGNSDHGGLGRRRTVIMKKGENKNTKKEVLNKGASG
jgi:hypothetical protein